MKIEGRAARWLIAFGFYLLQVWARTLRYEIDDHADVLGKPVAGNYIAALWHNRLLLISFVLKKFFPDRPGAGLISASRDGDLIADVTQRFGFDVVRGSSSRMGASALLELSEILASGNCEWPRIDDRLLCGPYRYVWLARAKAGDFFAS